MHKRKLRGKSLRVAVLEPYSILREGLCAMLARMRGVEVSGAFSSLSQFLPWYPRQRVDLLLVGYHLHSMISMSWMRFCEERGKGPAVLVLNGLTHPRHVRAAMDLGARGVVGLNAAPRELERAVRTVAAGRRYVAREEADPAGAALQALSTREFDTLMLTAMGFRLKDIAKRLGVAVQTVYSYRSRLCIKLGLKTVSEIVRFACDHGLLTPHAAGEDPPGRRAARRK